MSATLEECLIELSKQTEDYWSSTATSDGNVGGTTIVDTELSQKADDWVADMTAYDRIMSGTYDLEERKVSSLASGTLTTLAHGGKILNDVEYEIHRIASASEKRRALIWALRASFPVLHKRIQDESKVIGNWLRNGSFDQWASASYPDYWRVATVTATKSTTEPYVKFGSACCKLDTAAGYMYSTNTLVPDLQELAGQTVTFSIQAWCDTASALRLAVYDGTDTTYSDYHPGTSDWTKNSEPLEVTATIADTPTSVDFRVYLASAAATAYVVDARVIGPMRHKVYIGDLGLDNDTPHFVSVERSSFSQTEPWRRISFKVDGAGYLHYASGLKNLRMRIEGQARLDFLASGVASELWTATVAINAAQLDYLVALAAYYLYRQKSLPTLSTGDRKPFAEARDGWQMEYMRRARSAGMAQLPTGVDWGV